MALNLTVLGGFRAQVDQGPPLVFPTRKAQALLAYLAWPAGRAHSRDRLAALFWGGIREESARASLRQALFFVRRALGEAEGNALRQEGDALALDPGAVQVDAARLERLVAEGSPEALERAEALYRGDFLAGLTVNEAPFEEWLLAERDRLRELALSALGRLLVQRHRAGQSEAVVQTALRLLALDPLQESVHRTLMRAYAEMGRRGAALRQYQHCVGALRRELGTEPDTETKALYQEILRQRPAPVPTPDEGPGAGLRDTRPSPLPKADGLLIGRERELRSLRETLDIAAPGRPRMVAVVGEAGIGKTRLVTELVAEAEAQGARVLAGRSYEGEQVLPFGTWVDAFRTARPDLAGLAPSWRAELARLIPELASPEATRTGGPTDYLQIFEGVVQAIGHLAERQPLLLVLEDLHWADDMSVRLLSFVGRRLGDRPVLVVVTAREEDLSEVPVLRHALEDLRREGRLGRITLGPLSRADTMALVRLHARTGSDDGDPALLEEDAWIASEGNPFVAVEMVRAHAEGTAPARGRGLRLPERVREIVQRRLERLSERGRGLAAMAAVIGREFDFALLQQAAGLGEAEVAEGVEELVRRSILHGVDDGFAFTHERIREVAYGAVGVRRRSLHAAAGAALERRHAGRLEPLYDRLAYHYLRAEDASKAADYLTLFARKVTRAYAHEEAVKAYVEALRQLDRLADPEADLRRLDLVPRLTRSLMFLGRFEEARDLLLLQRPRVERLDNLLVTSQYHLLLSHVYGFLGDRERTVESARQTVAAAERAEDTGTLGKAFYVLAMEGWWSGSPQQGVEHGRRAVDLLHGSPDRWWLGQAHFAVAVNHVLMGDFEPALTAATRALEIGDAIGDPRVQTPAAWLTGTVHALRGDWEEGVAAGRRSLDYSPDPLNRADALGWLGLAYLERGDAPQAIEVLEQAVELWSRFQGRSAQGAFRILLGHAHLMGGAVDRAAKLAEEGLALTRETGYRLSVGWGERLMGVIARARGRDEEALGLLEQALATFTVGSARFEAARTRLLLAELAASLGDQAGATRRLDEARRAFAALKIPRYLAWSEELACRLAAGGSRDAAAPRMPRWT